MTLLIIGIILAILGVAASLYQLTTQSSASPEVIAQEYWWMVWPM
ncbi:MAG TPA: hypothetical protein VKE41_15975 [Roseiflexaceae bacterium]|nr:hypothetical protein [Roseiflexaceae bacterium]